jgi:dTDP-glucose 4,6-dehydratase
LPLPVYGDGGYVRDYQYVEDHCRGIDVVLRKGDYGEIYNLGGGNELRALDLAGIIIEKLGKPLSLVQLVADRQGQDRRYSLICDKINALGWKPQWTFDEAISSTIEWYVKNEWWWRKIKSGQYARFYEAQYTRRLEGAIRNVLG